MNSEHPMTDRVVYRSLMADNLRWDALQLRDGDIIISAPSKSGLTWTQRLVSLLVFDGPDLPGPLSTVSPWLDQTIRPIEEVVATLDAQQHRRFIKTHTPLDGLVLDDRVSYICVGRDPRDAAVSMLYQSANMNEDRMRILHEAVVPFHERIAPPFAELGHARSPTEEFRDWMEGPNQPPPGIGFTHLKGIGTLANILHQLGTVWVRRHLPNVALFHYADYQADLAGELLRPARVLGIAATRDRARDLAQYATLDAMRSRASEIAPNTTDGIWHSDERFFRRGGSGDWQQSLPKPSTCATTTASTSWRHLICWPGHTRAAGDTTRPTEVQCRILSCQLLHFRRSMRCDNIKCQQSHPVWGKFAYAI
ncbi:glycolipid sulfotransferase [Mycobacterium tuberculosis]|nr:glycolipid sulfotransferase [Mycobacterium tuberculosis]